MKVTFTRTGKRTYGIVVERDKIRMQRSPAPGFDERLPHDVAHFIVENELGILGGVFGQLAAGGTAGTFYTMDPKTERKAKRRGARIARENKKDASFAERAIYAAQSRWEKHEILQHTDLPQADISRLISKFEEFAEVWSKTPVGGSVTFEWNPRKPKKRNR